LKVKDKRQKLKKLLVAGYWFDQKNQNMKREAKIEKSKTTNYLKILLQIDSF